MRTHLPPRHQPSTWAVLAAVATLAVTFASTPATAQEPPAPASAHVTEADGPGRIAQGETIESSKATTSRIAQSDPELVARTDRAVVPVMIKLDYDPVATYAGGIKGLPATSPSTTDRALTDSIATNSAYAGHIEQAEAEIVSDMEAAVPALEVGTSFQVVYGGVAATVPANRIDDLLEVPGVVAVQSDEARQPLVDWGTTQIGAPAVWGGLGGQANAGSGVLFANIDSGVWPEHPALADTGATPPAPLRPDGTPIACNFGDNPLTPGTDVFACNDKLVGGRPFLDTYNRILGDTMFPTSARDSGGHGTHTATTAAGNSVQASLGGVDKGEISGVAPGAWVASYKVCGVKTCYNSDSAAAVQAAILDGVDVINYSITGGTNPATDPVELAFLDAYAAGVFVAASAGNTGPAAGTVNHLGPWTTTVAATGPATTTHGERVASFSSRGPQGQIVKPDLAAPGVSVLAGITPIAGDIGDGTSYYGYLQGTSMAAPHVAGAAVLLRALHPAWTPGTIRSALMGTATSGLTKEENGQLATPFDEGSGRISVDRADDPGLVLDETAARLGTLGLDPLNSVNLNLASVYAPKLAGKLVTTRTFTNTGGSATYTASTQAAAGSSITVAPASFSIAPGATQTVTITIRTTHETGGLELGAITLAASGRPDVRLPVAFDPEPGSVAITATGCDPATISVLDTSTCSYQIDNLSADATTVDLRATGDAAARVTGADLGASTAGGSAEADGVPIAGWEDGTPTAAYDSSGPDFTPLTGTATAIGDEQLASFTVPPYVFNGRTFARLYVSSNGYIVAGTATTADSVCCDVARIGLPARPNNVIAPFWTDLDGTGMPGIRASVLEAGGRSWIVVEWNVKVYGTSSPRTFQAWIAIDGPQDVRFAYDPAHMPAAPIGQTLVIGAENGAGAGTGLTPGVAPTGDVRVTSTEPVSHAITWNVDVEGTGAGAASIEAEASSPLIQGADLATNSLTVEALPVPVITTDPQDQTVTALQTATFTSAATGGTLTRWETSTNGGGTWSTVAGALTDTLSFTAHALQDGSQFRAVYANASGDETASADATVTVDKIETTTALSVLPSSSVTVGDAVSFKAEVSPATSAGTVQFQVDGADLGSPVALSSGAATSVSTSDVTAGNRIVTAVYSGDTDHEGSEDDAGFVVAALPPGAPTIGVAAARATSATVSWTPPSATGGSPITGYVVTPYLGATASAPRTFNSTATSQSITGLTSGKSYTFKVAARNSAGTGEQSEASNAVVPSGVFHLRNSNSSGPSIGGFSFGSPGDVAISGDWDGNGTTTIGVYRPSTATFYLRNANSAGKSIGGFTFGSPGDIPVVGDWDGDGTTTIGVFRPSTARFYLRNSNSAGPSIGGFTFGSPGDIPISGDWDGNGTTTIGVYRPSTATFYLRNANSAGKSIGGFAFGSPSDIPISGDWDGDGTTTIGAFRPSTATFSLRNANAAGPPNEAFPFGAPGDIPIVGDWDGNGTPTIGIFR